MCIRAYLNGDGSGYKTHFSVFFVLMRGEFDPLLKWPFEYKVTSYYLFLTCRRSFSMFLCKMCHVMCHVMYREFSECILAVMVYCGGLNVTKTELNCILSLCPYCFVLSLVTFLYSYCFKIHLEQLLNRKLLRFILTFAEHLLLLLLQLAGFPHPGGPGSAEARCADIQTDGRELFVQETN